MANHQLISSDLSQRLTSKLFVSIVEQPLIRVLLAQQTRAVPGNAFHVASVLANQNVLQLWKGLDASLMLQAANLFIESNRSFGWQYIALSLLALPFETVLTRLSTDPQMKEKNFFSVLWTIADHEGISGLMKGSLVRVFDTLSTTFLTSTIRPSIETALGQSSNLIEPSCIVASSILLYPLRILVRRLQSQTALDEKQSPLTKFFLILKKEGPSSFYSGFPFFILLTFIHHLTQLTIQNTLQ